MTTSSLNFALQRPTPIANRLSTDALPTSLLVFNQADDDIILLPVTDHAHVLNNLSQAHFRLSFPTGVIYPLSELAKLSLLRQHDWRAHYIKEDNWEHLYLFWVPITHTQPHLLLKGNHSRAQSQPVSPALNSLKLDLFHLFVHPGYTDPICSVELHCGNLVQQDRTSLVGYRCSTSLQLLHVKELSALPRQFVSEDAVPSFVQEDNLTALTVTDLIIQTETGWFRDTFMTEPIILTSTAHEPLTVNLQSDNNSGALYIANEPISMDIVIRNNDADDVTLSSSSINDLNQPSLSLPSLDWIKKVYSEPLTVEILQKFQTAVMLVQRLESQYGGTLSQGDISVSYTVTECEAFVHIPGVVDSMTYGISHVVDCTYDFADIPSQLASLTEGINYFLNAQNFLIGSQFALYFPVGVLQDPSNLSQVQVIKSTLRAANEWHIQYIQQTIQVGGTGNAVPCDCFYFYWIPSQSGIITLRGIRSHTEAPNSLSLTLNYLNASANHLSNDTSIQLTHGGKCGNAKYPIPQLQGHFNTELIHIINHTGKAICPLAMSFVNSDTILNDGDTINSLTFRIVNYSKQDNIPLTEQSQFTLVLDSSLASQKNLSDVVVKTPSYDCFSITKADNKANEWVIKPLKYLINLSWTAQLCFEFNISNLTTTADNGHSPISLYYDHLPGYWDGHIVTTIEKGPISYRSPAAPNSPGDNEPIKAVAVTISPRFTQSNNVENVGLAIKEGYLQVDENIILGDNRKGSRFILCPDSDAAGAGFFLAPDDINGNWDYTKSFVYKRCKGFIGIGTNTVSNITEGLHLFGGRNILLDGGGSIHLKGGEISSWGPVILHSDDDDNGDANALVVTKGKLSTTLFSVDSSGDLSTHGGWISSSRGTITTDGGTLSTRGGNFFTGQESSEGGGGNIYTRGGSIYLGGGGIDTQNGGITTQGGSIYLGGGGIDTQNGGITAWGGIHTGNISTTTALALAANGPITLSCDTDSTNDNPAFVIKRANQDVVKIWNDNHVAIDGYLTVTGSSLIDNIRVNISGHSLGGGDIGGGWYRVGTDIQYDRGGSFVYIEYHVAR